MLFHRSNPQSKIGVFGLSRCSRVYGPLCRADVAFGFNFFSNRTVVASLMQQVSSSLVGPVPRSNLLGVRHLCALLQAEPDFERLQGVAQIMGPVSVTLSTVRLQLLLRRAANLT